MTQKNYAYDHPLYLQRLYAGSRLQGASAVARFAAWTDMLVKSIELCTVTAGTSAGEVYQALKIAQGTATTTVALTTIGTGAAGLGSTNFTSTFTLAAGDSLAILKGTDATIDHTVGVELALVPGATVTA